MYHSAPVAAGSEPGSVHGEISSFLKGFQEGPVFVYRDQLRRNYEAGKYFLEVDLQDVDKFSMGLLEQIEQHPSDMVAAVRVPWLLWRALSPLSEPVSGPLNA